MIYQFTGSFFNGMDHPPELVNPGKTPLVEFARCSLEILEFDLLEAKALEQIRELFLENIIEDDHQIRPFFPLVDSFHLKGLGEAQSLLHQLGEYFRRKQAEEACRIFRGGEVFKGYVKIDPWPKLAHKGLDPTDLGK